MKKLILFFLILFLSVGANLQSSSVYICVSPSAKKYHFSKSCSGLQRCTHEISYVSKTAAQNKGYTICLLED